MLFCVANIFYQSLLKCLFVVVPYSYSELVFKKFIIHCIWVRYRSSLFWLFFINIKINSSPNYCLFVCLFSVHIVRLFVYIFYPNAQLVPEAWAVKTYTVNSGGPQVRAQTTCEVRGRGQQQGGNGAVMGWWWVRWEFFPFPWLFYIGDIKASQLSVCIIKWFIVYKIEH